MVLALASMMMKDRILNKENLMRFVMTFLFAWLLTSAAIAAPNVDVAVTSSFAASGGVGVTIVDHAQRYSVISSVTNVAPAAGTFTCAITDICTKSAHGYLTGLKVQASTSSALPAGLSTSTDYFVIKLSANTFSLASSLVLAQAGTAIDITDTGTGTQTITPTALAGASLKLQGSMDGTTYVDLPIRASGDASKSANITTSANFYLSEWDMNVNYIRVYYTLTAGQLSVSNISKVPWLGK